MIKKILVILLFIPILINAKECNQSKHDEYLKLAPNITNDNDYSMSSKKFTVIIYNIFDDMYVKYNGKTYNPDEESKVTIDNIDEGTVLDIDVYANDGCEAIKRITIFEPYYNKYYDDPICDGYKDKVAVCGSRFTELKVTLELVKEAKQNYDNAGWQGGNTKKEEVKEKTVFEVLLGFIKEWGIKILLVALTIFISSSIFNAKFRKIKHGI